MSSRTAIGLIAAALVLLILGLIFSVAALALIGLLGAIVAGAVWALAAGGDWIRDVSEGRFKGDGRS